MAVDSSGSGAKMDFIELQCVVQHYAWGDPSFIPALLGRGNATGKPFAELWMGAHPDGPSNAILEKGSVPLNRLIEADPEGILHHAVAARFGSQLPFLLKVLAAASPLSLQVHPSKAAAERGFEREDKLGVDLVAPHRNYRDRNHKPELIVALTEFYGLRGFRPLSDIEHVFRTLPELEELGLGFEPQPESLRKIYSEFMTWPQEKVDRILEPLIARLADEHERKAFTKSDREYWLLRANRQYASDGHHDRGLFSVYLLNLVKLRPGEGMYLPAGVLHAYLEGAGVEIMANSNNVLRGGWTPKHVDVPELLGNMIFEGGEPEIITGRISTGGSEWMYDTPADEFALSRVELDGQSPYQCKKDHAAEIFLVASVSQASQALHASRVTLRTDRGQAMLGRGAVFLISAGTHYEIIADAPATLFKATVPLVGAGLEIAPPQKLLCFRGLQPAELAFGTSGLRGLVTDMTDLEAYINTRGFLDYLLEIGDVSKGGPVSIACDLRPSSDSPDRSILRAVARAIQAAELVVDNLGRLPTPALIYYAMQQKRPGVMVTGSHIPFDRNGIKFNKSTGEILKNDEALILGAVRRVREVEYGRLAADSTFAGDGMFAPDHRPLPLTDNPHARDLYRRRYLDFFAPNALRGQRVAFYQHSAVGRDLLVELLTALGAHAIPVGRSETFVPIDTEAISDDKLRLLQQLADEALAAHGPVDAVISTDGDSDRPLLAGISAGGQVDFFAGDIVGIVVADFLKADSVVVPISCSDAVDRWASASGITVRKTRIGSPYVIEAMHQEAAHRAGRVVGWEANGGFLTGTDIERDGRLLRALPTRDAALPILAVLCSAREQGLSLVELFRRLPHRFSKSGLLDNCAPEASRAIVRRFSGEDAGIQEVAFTAPHLSVRRETETVMNTDARLASKWETIRLELERVFGPKDGFGSITRINILDGVRVHFSNGDIAHVRPSGNAPQLRIYAVADAPERAEQIVTRALEEPDGILRKLQAIAANTAGDEDLTQRIKRNIALTGALFSKQETPEVIGTVSGSQAAQKFWQNSLDEARSSFGARTAVSFHEDLPTNQAFGLLLLWQRLKVHIHEGRGALIAFVFGDGTRSTPFTETDNAQKPAIATFVTAADKAGLRFIPIVELAMKYFVPVQQYLRRSGFNGVVVKWGDEVQIPALDLSGADDLFLDANVVRFVSLREIGADEAKNKDWVGVDAGGKVTSFIPRRPISEMEPLADRGLVQRRDGKLFGGINLGSIALSYTFLDCLLEEFESEVNDATADRSSRPALDPEFFTALTIAAIEDPEACAKAWQRSIKESAEVEALNRRFPDMIDRLRRAIQSLEHRQARKLKMVAMDFGDQYWGDIGQHAKILEFYMALNRPGPAGEIARALAGLPESPDADGNLIVNSQVSRHITVRNSVLINAVLKGQGRVEGSVLIGTKAGDINIQEGFDVLSTVTNLHVERRGGTYKVASIATVHASPGQRLTTLFLPEMGAQLFRVEEDTDLKDKRRTYAVPILGNPFSFAEAHLRMGRVSVTDLAERRRTEEAKVLEWLEKAFPAERVSPQDKDDEG